MPSGGRPFTDVNCTSKMEARGVGRPVDRDDLRIEQGFPLSKAGLASISIHHEICVCGHEVAQLAGQTGRERGVGVCVDVGTG